MTEERVLVGAVIGPHGIRGEVKVKTFTEEPRSLAAYGPVETAQGDRLKILALRESKDAEVVVSFAGVKDRNTAELLKGIELYVRRDALPKPAEGEFYHADLVGLEVEDEGGAVIGKVRGVQNFGAGDLIEIEDFEGDLRFVPFTTEAVPVVDIAQGRIVIVPPRSSSEDKPE